jgi:hypothetical protein
VVKTAGERAMRPYKEAVADVITEITAVFDGVSREDGVTLHETGVIDGYGSEDERAKARLLDTESRWQDVPDDNIRNFHPVLNFLDSKGFRYYIPAYMIWTLRNCDVWSNTQPHTIYSLLFDPKDVRSRDWYLERFDLLSPEQSKAISHFLRIVATYKDWDLLAEAQQALDQYWGQFE